MDSSNHRSCTSPFIFVGKVAPGISVGRLQAAEKLTLVYKNSGIDVQKTSDFDAAILSWRAVLWSIDLHRPPYQMTDDRHIAKTTHHKMSVVLQDVAHCHLQLVVVHTPVKADYNSIHLQAHRKVFQSVVVTGGGGQLW